MSLYRVDYHSALNVFQISARGDSIFIRRDEATGFLGDFMRALALSAPSDAHDDGASGEPALPNGTPRREGADIHHLDPHSRKVDDAA